MFIVLISSLTASLSVVGLLTVCSFGWPTSYVAVLEQHHHFLVFEFVVFFIIFIAVFKIFRNPGQRTNSHQMPAFEVRGGEHWRFWLWKFNRKLTTELVSMVEGLPSSK